MMVQFVIPNNYIFGINLGYLNLKKKIKITSHCSLPDACLVDVHVAYAVHSDVSVLL
jgi:hypothetical protein